MLGLSFCLGQLHLTAHRDHQAIRCWDITLPGKPDSFIPNENCSGDATVTTSYQAEILRSSLDIVNCLAVRF